MILTVYIASFVYAIHLANGNELCFGKKKESKKKHDVFNDFHVLSNMVQVSTIFQMLCHLKTDIFISIGKHGVCNKSKKRKGEIMIYISVWKIFK